MKLMDRLRDNVTELAFINFDSGEVDEPEQNYSIPFPAVLISVETVNWTDQANGIQRGDTIILARCCFDVIEDMNNTTPEQIATAAKTKLLLINKIHSFLQGYGGETFTKLSRVQSETEKRADGLFVYNMRYRVNYVDTSAQQDWTLVKIEGFDVQKKPFPIPDPVPPVVP